MNDLQAFIKSKKLSQVEFSQKTGINKFELSRILNNKLVLFCTHARSAESWFGITECKKCKEKYTIPHQEEIAKTVERLYLSLFSKINTSQDW